MKTVLIILGLFSINTHAQDLYGQDQTTTINVYEIGLSGKAHQTIDMSEIELTHQNGEIKQIIKYDFDGDIEILEIGEE